MRTIPPATDLTALKKIRSFQSTAAITSRFKPLGNVLSQDVESLRVLKYKTCIFNAWALDLNEIGSRPAARSYDAAGAIILIFHNFLILNVFRMANGGE